MTKLADTKMTDAARRELDGLLERLACLEARVAGLCVEHDRLVAELADADEALQADRAIIRRYIARDRPTPAEVAAGTIADQLVRGALSRSAPAMASHRKDGTGY